MAESAVISVFIYEYSGFIPEDAEGNMTLIPDDEVREYYVEVYLPLSRFLVSDAKGPKEAD